MLISAILAMASNGVVGVNNRLPWSLPAEMALFRKKTLHKHIIMGRATAQSLTRALPQRKNCVISHKACEDLLAQGMFVFPSLDTALEQAEKDRAEECVIIGGSQIWSLSIDSWQRCYLSEIHHEFAGDTLSPLKRFGNNLYFQENSQKDWQKLEQWQLIDEQCFVNDLKNAYAFTHSSWEKR